MNARPGVLSRPSLPITTSLMPFLVLLPFEASRSLREEATKEIRTISRPECQQWLRLSHS